MIPSLFYPINVTFKGFELTDIITNITFPTTLENDIAYPYYMGYISPDNMPDDLIPVTMVEDEMQEGVYKFVEAFERQNVSWFYMAQNVTSQSSDRQIIYRDVDNDNVWKYLLTSSNRFRFINSGEMSTITTYANFTLRMSHFIEDTTVAIDDPTHFTYSRIVNSSSMTYQDIYDLLYNDSTITFDNITFSQTNFDSNDNWYKIPDETTPTLIHWIAFHEMLNGIDTFVNSSSGHLQYRPFVKWEDETTGKCAYISPKAVQRDFRIHVAVPNATYADYDAYITASGSLFYDNILLLNNSDFKIDAPYLYANCRGSSGSSHYLIDGTVFSYTGYITANRIYYEWRFHRPLNPEQYIKLYRLFNKFCISNSNTYRYSTSYFTGLGVSYFNDDNVPLFTGKNPTDSYTYADVYPDLQPWQYSGMDITVNDYDDDTKPDPDEPPTAGDEITTEKHNNENSLPALSGIRTVSGDAFSTFYHLSMYHVAELGQIISQMPQSFWEALGTATDYKQSNILDYLVSLKWYPLNITDSTDTVTSDLQFGFNGIAKITFTATGTSYKIGNINRIYNMGSITIPYRAAEQSFLDLEPYTSVSAYLPYIGTVSLQANDVVGYTITCTYIVDLTTGMCTGILDNSTDTIYIGTGKIGVDISVSGNDILTQSEKMASSVLGVASGAISNVLSLGASVADVNVAGAASAMTSAVTDLATSAIGIANSKRGIPETVGSASGFGGGYTHQAPYIRVQRPAVSIPGKYGHDVGYVCNRSYTIGTLSGYTVCSNPDLSGIPATSAELDMIRSLLMSGFYA